MKRTKAIGLLLLLVLLSLAVASAQDENGDKKKKRGFQHRADILTEYDKAKNETKVELKRMSVLPVRDPRAHILHLTAYYTYPGKEPSKPQEVVVGFVSANHNKDRKFQDTRDFVVKLDGKEINFGTMELIESRLMGTYYKEVLGIYIPFDNFFQLVDNNKDTLEMSLGNTRFQLVRENMEALRDLASRIEK